MEAVFASSPYWTNTPGNAWPFILGWSIRAIDVITVVEVAIARYGMPEHLRSDNGPEFIACCIQDWLKAQKIKTLYIKAGEPLGKRAH